MTPYDNGTGKAVKRPTSGVDQRPTREEAEAAVETLIRWMGETPGREGLVDTPARVVRAWEEFCAGYDEDPTSLLTSTFEEVEGYDDMVMLRSIRMESHCEHHLVPILGVAHIAYLPDQRVVGISKLARVLDGFSRRLQTQETLTAQVADCIQTALKPRGVAVLIDAQHQCMTTRGVHKPDVSMVTTRFTGAFETDRDLRNRFLDQTRLG
ncbi:MAG: GTP cyclohydrolase I FolE [Pseudomonadota bacterium]|nr:GTP cyclohydrolase I FolE [Pseudomonadota bacterium]MEC7853114.1 GTP cyclohydrolase I FolE [Pseudomonadota bacterium]MEC8088886.1 GTP cyclohydrolase I FolE [Pseudomonadota bacterium]MEC8129582.1 GTP cyclohydrolase I FolE [Pseudomonadota bacterium]MEC9145790.1 GTP cyclohydrolase I FolE [Pseudomonadota bacterium]